MPRGPRLSYYYLQLKNNVFRAFRQISSVTTATKNRDEGILDRSHGLYWPSACTHNARARLGYSRTGARHPKRSGPLVGAAGLHACTWRCDAPELAWRAKGLPLVIAMPNAVVGANDHSAFGGDATFAFVDVHALAEGMCLTVEKAPIGEDYIFSGEPIALGALFEKFARYPGGMKVRLYLQLVHASADDAA
jgi:hypothetical protein